MSILPILCIAASLCTIGLAAILIVCILCGSLFLVYNGKGKGIPVTGRGGP
jgi:hypothetical protein